MARRPRRLAASDYFVDGAFPFRLDRHRITSRLIAPHRHEFTELVIVLSGRGEHLTGGRRYAISAGDVFVIAGDRAHAYRDLEALELVNCLFLPDRLLNADRLLRRIPGYRALFLLEPRYRERHGFRSRLRLDPEGLQTVSRWLTQIEKEIQEETPGYEAMVVGYLEQLVVYLSRRYSRTRTEATRSLLRVADVLGHLEAHYDERLALAELAERAHMSVNNFLRVFRDATGYSPIRYQIRVRVLQAAELLRDRGCTVAEAAFAVGFNDSNYFSKQFTRTMGRGPRAYRAEMTPGPTPSRGP